MKKSNLLFLISTVFVICFFGSAGHPLSQELKAERQNGVTVISNLKTPRPDNGLPIRIVFTEELSIGVKEGDENYMFGDDVIFNTDDKGNFYVTDWDRRRILKFDSGGNFLLKFGKKGQGPGDFQNISKVRFNPGGDLYVVDIGSRRISFFDPKGNFLRIIKSPVRLSHNLQMNSQGFFIFREGKILEYLDGSDAFILTYGLFDKNFDLVAEFYSEKIESGPPPSRDEDSIAKSLAEGVGEYAFKPTTSYVVRKDDYVYFGNSEKYEIMVFNPVGKLIKTINREYDPIRVTKKDIDAYAQDYKENVFDTLPISEEIKAKALRLAKYPKYKSAYNNFTLMENGWLLVIVDSLNDEYALFDIFDQEGKYIAQFDAAIPTRGLFFKNGKAYSVATEDSYKFVKRYSFEIQEFMNNTWKRME